MARGEVVVFIDDDCVATRAWLERLLPAFSDGEVAGVEGKVLPTGEQSPLRHWVTNSGGGQYLTANVAYRREHLNQVGGFDESYPVAGGEDYDLAYRTFKMGYRIAFQDDAIVYHPTYHHSFTQFIGRRLAWWSSVRLSRKHPRFFKEHTGRTGRANILFYATVYPVYHFLRWRRWLLDNPRDLPSFVLRMFFHVYYGMYVLLRTLAGRGPPHALIKRKFTGSDILSK